MKLINKLGLLAGISSMFLAISCNEDIPERGVSPFTPENCFGVFFSTTNETVVELDPTEPTEITYVLARVDTVNALEVPITVEVNDGDVFVVPQKVTFAAMEKETTFTVTFPTAAEGVTYKLRMALSGDEFVNKYAEILPYQTTNVTRIKWTAIDPIIYVDGTFGTLYGVSQYPMYVETDIASVGTSVRYRLKNAYRVPTGDADANGIFDGYPYNDPGDFDEANDYYTFIEVDKDGNVTMSPNEIGVIWSYGMFSIGSTYGNLSTNIAEYPLGTLDENLITFPENSLYISMANLNNDRKYPCDVFPTYIYLTKEAYLAANMKIKNFNDVEYEVISGAVSEYESIAYNGNWQQSFAKAIDIDAKNKESEYKNLYYLADLYAENYGLAFYYDGKTLSIPVKQPIGTTVFGKDIFVSPSDDIESTVTTTNKGVTAYTLGLKFHFEDGTVVGEFAETYFYSEEALSYSITDFYGDYTLTGPSVFDGEPNAKMDVSIEAGVAANTFVITGIDLAESVEATFDPQTSTLSIAPQELADYGPYDITLYTLTADDDVSDEATLDFALSLKGNLHLTPTSEAIGYLLSSEAIGGWVDGYYNLLFTPTADTKSAVKSTASHSLTSKTLNKVSVTKAQKCAKGNFAVQGKISPKTLRKNIGTPIF